MAMWQYDFTLTPTHPIDFDELQTHISSILPSLRSWSDSLLMWGKSDGNRIDLNVDADCPELIVRFDLRHPSKQFLQQVLAMAIANSFVIRNDEDRIIPTTAEALATDMMRSDAFRFLSDPQKFLGDLESLSDL